MNADHTIKTVLLNATQQLTGDEAKLEARLLLQHVLGVDRAWLITHENDIVHAGQLANFQALLVRRTKGEPIAYLLGYREFFGLRLKVTADTLIPRPDTETLVEAALAKSPNQVFQHRIDDFNVLDLGTGTGAIALAIASQRPQARVTAVDVSKPALKIAEENAQTLKISNVRFLHSRWFSSLKGERFDIIVSNPPYIKVADPHLSQGDLRFEPLSALASGTDGLDDIRQIIAQSMLHLKPQGWL